CDEKCFLPSTRKPRPRSRASKGPSGSGRLLASVFINHVNHSVSRYVGGIAPCGKGEGETSVQRGVGKTTREPSRSPINLKVDVRATVAAVAVAVNRYIRAELVALRVDLNPGIDVVHSLDEERRVFLVRPAGVGVNPEFEELMSYELPRVIE